MPTIADIPIRRAMSAAHLMTILAILAARRLARIRQQERTIRASMKAVALHHKVAGPESQDAFEANYQRNGWTRVPGYFTAAEMGGILSCVQRLSSLPEVPGRQMVYREASLLDPQTRVIQRIEDFCRYDVELDGWVRDGRLQSSV